MSPFAAVVGIAVTGMDCISRSRPFADRNDGCDGMIMLSAAASELIGIIPSEGIQSMRI